jgi:methylase of polypeptide subunit release factors
MPTLHACGRRHGGIGLDLDAEAVSGASLNASLLSRRNVAFVRADLLAATGRFAMVMSNPPYIPTDRRNLEPALEVYGDGTGVIEAIFATYQHATRDFVLHFASISNPARVCQLADRAGFCLAHLELTLAPFGAYTSMPKRLAHLLKCRRRLTAFFHDEPSNRKGGRRFRQLLMTAHFTAKRRTQRVQSDIAVTRILEAFQEEGTASFRGLRRMDRGFSMKIVVPLAAQANARRVALRDS